jgi:hypothetical protein
MQKLVMTTAIAAAIVLSGALAWNASAQTSNAAAIIGSNKSFTPVEKVEPAACRGWGLTVLQEKYGPADGVGAGALGASIAIPKI